MSKLIKRIAISFAVLAVSVCLVGPAQALTADELQAQITALTAQLTALQGQLGTTTTTTTTTGTTGTGAASGCTAFTRNLTIGSTGNDVKCLQILLNANGAQVAITGAGAPGYETLYFGNLTRAAVSKFQAANAIAPIAGFFGPITRAKMNTLLGSSTSTSTTTTGTLPAGCTSTAGYSPTTGVSCASGTTTTLPTSAGLTVALASDTPASATIVSDGAGGVAGSQALVPVLGLNFSTPEGTTAKVTGLILNRAGISTDSDIDNVYLYDGSTRIAEMTSYSLGIVTFSNASGLFTVSGVKNITVKFDLNKDATSGKTIAFQVAAATSVTTDASSVNGTFPITGNTMSTATVSDFGRLQLTGQATAATVDPGTTGFEAFKFILQATNQNIKLYSVKFLMFGSIDSADIKNFTLYDGATQLGSVAALASDKSVTFDLSAAPLLITSGQTKNISLRIDVVNGSTRTIQFSLQRAADIVAMDANYNVYLKVDTGTIGSFSITSSTSATVASGNLIATKATDSPSGTVTLNATNVTLAKYNVQAIGEGIKVSQIRYRISEGTGANTWTNIKNVRVFYDGVQVGTTATTVTRSTGDDNNEGTLSVNFTVPAGTTKVLEIKADIASASGAGTPIADTYKLQAHLQYDSSDDNAQRLVSLGTFDFPSSDQDGNELTVSTASLTALKNNSFGNPTIVQGALNQKIASFLLTAAASEAINVTGITLIDGDGATVNVAGATSLGKVFNNIKLMQGTTQIGTTKSTNPSDAVGTTYAFYPSPALVVPAGTTVQFDVYADVSSTANADYTDTDGVELDSVTATGAVTSTSASFSGANGKAGQAITITTSGTLSATVESTPLITQVLMGATDQTLGQWKLTGNSVENITVSQLAVTNSNAGGDANVRNLKVFVGGTQVGSTIPALDGSHQAWFRDLSINVPKASSTVVVLKGDVTPYDEGASAGTQATFYITVPASITGATTDTIIARGASGSYATTSGSGNKTANSQYPYRSLLTAVLSTAHTSTGNTRAASDKVASLTLTGSATDAQLRASLGLDTAVVGAGLDDAVGNAETTNTVDGTGGAWTVNVDAGDWIYYDAGSATALYNSEALYSKVSFWIKVIQGDSAVTPKANFKISTNTVATAVGANATAITIPDLSGANMTDSTWYFVNMSIPTLAASHQYVIIETDAVTGLADTDVIYIDELRVYNDSIVFDTAGNLAAAGTTNALPVYLKTGGVTVGVGYYVPTSTTSATAGSVTIIPDSLISVGATPGVYDIYTNTNTLMATDDTATQSLSVSADMGTPASAGDFRWYDQSVTTASPITWLNPVSGSTSVSMGY